MAHIALNDVTPFAESTKMPIASIESVLEVSETIEVLARLSNVFDTSTWVDDTTTPSLVRKIIAMRYISAMYLRTYAEDEDTSSYGRWLYQRSEMLLNSLASGTLILTDPDDEVVEATNPATPEFYPNDESSAETPTYEDPSGSFPI